MCVCMCVMHIPKLYVQESVPVSVILTTASPVVIGQKGRRCARAVSCGVAYFHSLFTASAMPSIDNWRQSNTDCAKLMAGIHQD